jgi:hypothetical protein
MLKIKDITPVSWDMIQELDVRRPIRDLLASKLKFDKIHNNLNKHSDSDSIILFYDLYDKIMNFLINKNLRAYDMIREHVIHANYIYPDIEVVRIYIALDNLILPISENIVVNMKKHPTSNNILQPYLGDSGRWVVRNALYYSIRDWIAQTITEEDGIIVEIDYINIVDNDLTIYLNLKIM